MDAQNAIDLGREAIRTCLMIGGPILAVSLAIGLLLGIVQAMTQVQDQTVSFVPKALIVMLMIGLFLPWLSDQMIEFSRGVLSKPLLMAGSIGQSSAWTPPGDAGQKSGKNPEKNTPFKLAQTNSAEPASLYPASFSRQVPDLAKVDRLGLDSPAARVAGRTSPFQLPSHRSLEGKVRARIAVPPLQKSNQQAVDRLNVKPTPFVLPHAPVADAARDDLEG